MPEPDHDDRAGRLAQRLQDIVRLKPALRSRTQLTAVVLVKLARVRGLGHRLHFRDFRIRLAITSAPDDRPSFSSELGGIPSGSRGLWFSRRSG